MNKPVVIAAAACAVLVVGLGVKYAVAPSREAPPVEAETTDAEAVQTGEGAVQAEENAIASPNTAGNADMANGKAVYDHWCAACHDPGPGHPGTQSLAIKYDGERPAALEERTDLSPELTSYFVRNGYALMPFFRKTEISDADLRDLSAYLARGE